MRTPLDRSGSACRVKTRLKRPTTNNGLGRGRRQVQSSSPAVMWPRWPARRSAPKLLLRILCCLKPSTPRLRAPLQPTRTPCDPFLGAIFYLDLKVADFRTKLGARDGLLADCCAPVESSPGEEFYPFFVVHASQGNNRERGTASLGLAAGQN
jgi:hypothetical protein